MIIASLGAEADVAEMNTGICRSGAIWDFKT